MTVGMTSPMKRKIERSSLLSLEEYAGQRAEFRRKVIEHKRNRMVQLGTHVTLHFEDELTVRYQVQEMLRAERTFEDSGILNELEAYNPLVPDGCNFKVTMMLEFPDSDERAVWLGKLIGIEDRVWLQVDGFEKVWAIADEDLDRETAEKTSAVHFLRFELTPEMVTRLKSGDSLDIGVDHSAYQSSILVSSSVRESLVNDLA